MKDSENEEGCSIMVFFPMKSNRIVYNKIQESILPIAQTCNTVRPASLNLSLSDVAAMNDIRTNSDKWEIKEVPEDGVRV